MERFIAVLIEHCGGNFPLWLTPDQVAVIPVSEKYNAYAAKALQTLGSADIRGFVDERNEKVGKKIRDNELKKIPFMLVVGEKEEAEGQVAVREHGKGDIGVFSINDFIKFVNEIIEGDFKEKVSQ
jgi:threonyl-tRNA synthetase